MDREVGLLKALAQGVDQLEEIAGAAAVLGAMPTERQTELLAEVVARAFIQAEEAPGATPVEPEAEVPGDAVELHGLIKGCAEAGQDAVVFAVGEIQAQLKDRPEFVDVGRITVAVIGEVPGLLVVEDRDPFEALWNRLLHTEKGGDLAGNRLTVAVSDAAIEETEQGEGINIGNESFASIAELIAREQVQALHTGLGLLQEADQLLAIMAMGSESVSNRLVKASPAEAMRARGCISEAITPERAVAKAIEILGVILKRESDQGIVLPLTRQNTPDGAPVGIEEPLPWRAKALPVDADLAAIARIFSHHTGGLDLHHRGCVAIGFERKAMLLGVGSLDGDPIPEPHGAHLGANAVVIEAVLPDAFIDEAIGLVATVHHSADKPARVGALGNFEWWWRQIHVGQSL